MTKKKRRILLLLVVLALLVSALWYTAPRTAEDLFPDFQWDRVTYVSGAYDRYEENDHPAKAPLWFYGVAEAIPIDSAEGQALLTLLQNTEYRRSLWNLIPSTGARSYGPLQPGDLDISVNFVVDGEPGYLTVRFYFDEMIVNTGESKEYACSASGQDDLAQQMLSILQPLATETNP